DGTRIENSADIYFDFNAPVTTNIAWNEVNVANMPVSFLDASISPTGVACYGDSNGTATVTATGGLRPYYYQWSNGAHTATVSGLKKGRYYVTVTDAAESTIIDSVNIDEPAANTVSITLLKNACYGINDGSAFAVAAGGTTPYRYAW